MLRRSANEREPRRSCMKANNLLEEHKSSTTGASSTGAEVSSHHGQERHREVLEYPQKGLERYHQELSLLLHPGSYVPLRQGSPRMHRITWTPVRYLTQTQRAYSR